MGGLRVSADIPERRSSHRTAPLGVAGQASSAGRPPAPAPSADAPPAARSCPGELPARPQQPPGPGLWARRHLLTDPSSSSEFPSWFGRARAELAFQLCLGLGPFPAAVPPLWVWGGARPRVAPLLVRADAAARSPASSMPAVLRGTHVGRAHRGAWSPHAWPAVPGGRQRGHASHGSLSALSHLSRWGVSFV